MRKAKPLIALLLIICTLSSCATVFGGHVNSYQRTKPGPGQETRPLRVAAFICDIVLFWPGLIVDFATCAIYRPHNPDETTPAPVVTAPNSETSK